jgi:hypothetical protein
MYSLQATVPRSWQGRVPAEAAARSSVRIQLLGDGKETEAVAVPASALRLFLHLLTECPAAPNVSSNTTATPPVRCCQIVAKPICYFTDP